MNNYSHQSGVAFYIGGAFLAGVGVVDIISDSWSGWLAVAGIVLFIIGGVIDWAMGGEDG